MYAHKLFHFAVHLKLIQYCNSAIPHSKIPQMHYWRLWSCDELLKTKLHWMQEGESRPEFKALHLEVVLLVVQMGKTLPAMWVTWVQSLGQGDPLEEGMATHSSILAWSVPMDREDWQATVHGVVKSWTRLGNSAHHSVYLLIPYS